MNVITERALGPEIKTGWYGDGTQEGTVFKLFFIGSGSSEEYHLSRDAAEQLGKSLLKKVREADKLRKENESEST